MMTVLPEHGRWDQVLSGGVGTPPFQVSQTPVPTQSLVAISISIIPSSASSESSLGQGPQSPQKHTQQLRGKHPLIHWTQLSSTIHEAILEQHT